MTKYALLVGINYIGKTHSLSGCINDVNNVRGVLTNSYGFNSVRVLTDNTFTKPSRANIIYNLSKMLYEAKPGDTCMFYYSGHGLNIKDSKDGDEADGYDEAILCLDDKLITDDEFNLLLSYKCDDCKLTMVFDCCMSGTICDLACNMESLSHDTVKLHFGSSSTSNAARLRHKALESKNICVMSGCRDSQVAVETIGGGGDRLSRSQTDEVSQAGVFTTALLEVLDEYIKAKQLDSSTMLRNIDLLAQVTAKLKNRKFEQIAQLSCSNITVVNDNVFV